MLTEPEIKQRKEHYYLAIEKTVHMHAIPEVLPPLIPEVKEWMMNHHIEADGPDFFLYKSVNAHNELECVVGFPVGSPAEGDGRVVKGSFPAGAYASIIYTGDFKDMMQGHMALEKWIKDQGLKEKTESSEDGVCWGSRTEHYLVDPANEPDSNKWQTEISFLLED